MRALAQLDRSGKIANTNKIVQLGPTDGQDTENVFNSQQRRNRGGGRNGHISLFRWPYAKLRSGGIRGFRNDGASLLAFIIIKNFNHAQKRGLIDDRAAMKFRNTHLDVCRQRLQPALILDFT